MPAKTSIETDAVNIFSFPGSLVIANLSIERLTYGQRAAWDLVRPKAFRPKNTRRPVIYLNCVLALFSQLQRLLTSQRVLQVAPSAKECHIPHP
jgi:hypothetical protein